MQHADRAGRADWLDHWGTGRPSEGLPNCRPRHKRPPTDNLQVPRREFLQSLAHEPDLEPAQPAMGGKVQFDSGI